MRPKFRTHLRLCRQLLAQQPKKLVLYEVSELALYNIDRELREMLIGDETAIVPVLGSVTDARLTRAVLAQNGVDTVFHAAAYKHVPLVEQNPTAGIANNVFGTRTLADACVEEGVRRFILISTDKAVRPSNLMGASKRLAELVVQDRAKRSQSTRFSIVRFGNVLGSSGSVIPLFREQIARGGPVTLTFPGETAPARFTNAPYLRVFSQPNTNIFPYGPVEFLDNTFLPGTVALDVFGHVVEFVPRTLYLDGREVGWLPGTNIVVPMTGKLPVEKRPKRRER